MLMYNMCSLFAKLAQHSSLKTTLKLIELRIKLVFFFLSSIFVKYFVKTLRFK